MALIDSNPIENNVGLVYLGDPANFPTAYAQTFTGDGSQLTYAALFVFRSGSPTGNVYAKLYATSSGIPTGSPLATSDPVDASIFSSDSYSRVLFPFSTPYTLSNGTTYAISIEYSAGDSSNFLVVATGSPTSHSGTGYLYTQGIGWAEITTPSSYDLIFYLYSGQDVMIRVIGTPVGVDATSITPGIPSGTQVGDLMVMVISTGAYNYPTHSTPSGWVKQYSSPNDSNFNHFSVYTRFFQSGDGDPTVGQTYADPVIGVIISLVNADTSTIFDISPNSNWVGTPTSPFDVTISAITPSVAGSMAIFIWGSTDDNTWVYQSGGGDELLSFDSTAGSDNALCIVDKPMPTAESTGDQVARETNKAGDPVAVRDR